jgi:ribosomal biogenesis protein LAS1
MKLPRRVPWSSIVELDQVCSWVYADVDDLNSKQLAVNRVSLSANANSLTIQCSFELLAWKAITALPHALESTLTLLVVYISDYQSQNAFSSRLFIRLSYASALIRLVNGLVDPLQFGAYARSIASIAMQLGLPLWLVELRHASTHEELPSLELLREGAKQVCGLTEAPPSTADLNVQSMSWLLNNYWLPTINPTQIAPVPTQSLQPILPVLKVYKATMKDISRDVSMKAKRKATYHSVVKGIENWISEARVAGSVSAAELDMAQEVKEELALEKFCDALLEKGVLVPLSKKYIFYGLNCNSLNVMSYRKRVSAASGFLPPELSVKIWEPLLTHLHSTHREFSATLVNRILHHLQAQDRMETRKRDTSFELCLARWVVWITVNLDDSEVESRSDLKQTALLQLLSALGPETSHRDANSAYAVMTETLSES